MQSSRAAVGFWRLVMGYATVADMVDRFDERNLGDIVADDGTRVTNVTPTFLLRINPKMIAALDSASGQVNAACLQGERYSVDDLAGLKGDSKAYLVHITCVVALGALWQRKLYTEDNPARTEALQRMDQELTRLRDGEFVFDVTAAKEAGRGDVSTVSRSVIQNQWNLVVERVRGKLYPPRRTFRGP